MSWSISYSGKRQEVIDAIRGQIHTAIGHGHMTLEQEEMIHKAIETYPGNTLAVSGSGHNETSGTQQCYCSVSVNAYNDPKLNVEGASSVNVGGMAA